MPELQDTDTWTPESDPTKRETENVDMPAMEGWRDSKPIAQEDYRASGETDRIVLIGALGPLGAVEIEENYALLLSIMEAARKEGKMPEGWIEREHTIQDWWDARQAAQSVERAATEASRLRDMNAELQLELQNEVAYRDKLAAIAEIMGEDPGDFRLRMAMEELQIPGRILRGSEAEVEAAASQVEVAMLTGLDMRKAAENADAVSRRAQKATVEVEPWLDKARDLAVTSGAPYEEQSNRLLFIQSELRRSARSLNYNAARLARDARGTYANLRR